MHHTFLGSDGQLLGPWKRLQEHLPLNWRSGGLGTRHLLRTSALMPHFLPTPRVAGGQWLPGVRHESQRVSQPRRQGVQTQGLLHAGAGLSSHSPIRS